MRMGPSTMDQEAHTATIYREVANTIMPRFINMKEDVASNHNTRKLPILDMANHGCPPTADYRLVDNQIHLTATRALNEQEPVTIFYGNHCNRELAGCYGFVPTDNPCDYELLSLIEILQAAKDAGALECDNVFSLEESVVSLGLPTTNLASFVRWFGSIRASI